MKKSSIEYKFNAKHIIECGHSLDILKEYEDKKFDLIITSPPYNVGKYYETKTSIEEYLATQEEIILEILKFKKTTK